LRDGGSIGEGGSVENLERRSGSHSTPLKRLKFFWHHPRPTLHPLCAATAAGICIIAVRV